MGFNGLEGVWPRLMDEPARSRRALRAALGVDETRERGVKNLWNFLGVIDGFLFSLPSAGTVLGGEERRSLVNMADLLVEEEALSPMVNQNLPSSTNCKNLTSVSLSWIVGSVWYGLGVEKAPNMRYWLEECDSRLFYKKWFPLRRYYTDKKQPLNCCLLQSFSIRDGSKSRRRGHFQVPCNRAPRCWVSVSGGVWRASRRGPWCNDALSTLA